MAKRRLTTYTFDASAQTITQADFSDVTLAGIQVITNVTDQVIIYNFADTTKGGTLAGDVLTLEYDTTTMSDTDELMILVEDGVYATPVSATALPLPTGAATLAEQQTQSASLSVLDDWDETNRAAVNTIAGQVGVQGGAGTLNALTQRVTIATDDEVNNSLGTIAGAVSGTEMQVDVLTMPSVTVTATDLDVRNLVFATDKVDVSGSTVDTELPTAAALADNTANPTVPAVGGFGMVWDGATWDRQPGTAADGTLVNLGTNNDVTVTGTVTEANSAAALTALQLIDNAVSGTGFNISQVNGEAVDVGAGTEAAAIRVTLPTNGTGILAGVTTVTTLTGTTTLTPGTGATNLGKAIDTAGGATDTGVAELAIRDDALTTLTPVDGDYVANRVNARGAKWVAIEDGAGGQITSFGGGTEVAEDTAHSSGVLGGVPMAVRRDTPTSLAGSDNDYVPQTTDANGALWVSMATKLDATNDAVAIGSRTTGGLTTYHLVSAATTNASSVKASAGQLYGWYIYNSNAAARKVAFHNTAGTPTAGASVFFSLVIPAGGGANVFVPQGIAFGTGIGITTVTGLADSDSAAVAANDLIINLYYS